MVVEFNKKVKIPNQNETEIKISIIADEIGCRSETLRLLKVYKDKAKGETNPHACHQLAIETIQSLCKLDPRLVGWLANENFEIVVGGVVAVKFK